MNYFYERNEYCRLAFYQSLMIIFGELSFVSLLTVCMNENWYNFADYKNIQKADRLKKLLATISVVLLIVSIFPRCAKIVTPLGGPKDTIAPVLVRSIPAMNSLNFKGDKITLAFNEYIVLKDIQKKLAISPPMVKSPIILQRGKSLEIQLREPLRENTTYTLYFADAIVDNNEGNPIKSFEFAFSTGNVIDSLTVSGKIANVFTLLPEDNAFVMLYDNQNDSVPIKELPRYLTRADKKGLFIFKNLQLNDYKVFALRDNNSNYKFDQVSEDIAFLNEPLKKDALQGPSQIDTSAQAKREIYLNMFKENNRIQAITGFSRSERRKLALPFTKKPEGQIILTPLNAKVDGNWYLEETNQLQDSVIYWITDDRISAIDTLKIQVSYLKSDSLQHLQPQLDTLRFIYVEKEEFRKSKESKEKEAEKKVYLKGYCSINNAQAVKPTLPFEIKFPIPLKKIDESLIILTNIEDSTKVSGFKPVIDSLTPRLYRFNSTWAPDVFYDFKALPGAFTSLDGVENDTIKVRFKGANPENFGVLIITLLNVNKAVIVELLDEKRTRVFEHKIVQPAEKAIINFINPGKYTLRFIEDSNANGVWDTGWYLKGVQPEKVFNYDEGKTKGVLNIRANWENEITFDFAK